MKVDNPKKVTWEGSDLHVETTYGHKVTYKNVKVNDKTTRRIDNGFKKMVIITTHIEATYEERVVDK